MTTTIRKSQKCCSTCKWWQGKRKPSFSRDSVEYEAKDSTSECSRLNQNNVSAGYSCQYWEQWL